MKHIIFPSSSSMSLKSALNFDSNWPRIPDPATIWARSRESTRFPYRDYGTDFQRCQETKECVNSLRVLLWQQFGLPILRVLQSSRLLEDQSTLDLTSFVEIELKRVNYETPTHWIHTYSELFDEFLCKNSVSNVIHARGRLLPSSRPIVGSNLPFLI
jgi:hypothetical protein